MTSAETFQKAGICGLRQGAPQPLSGTLGLVGKVDLRFMHGESGVTVFRRPKLLHELVIPEDDTASVSDRRPRMDQFLLPSMWGLPVSGPDTPESSSIEGSKALHRI